jgi:hypothetical protein
MLIKGQPRSDLLYLSGGIRAATHKDGYLFLFPTTDGQSLAYPTITIANQYYKAIRSFGLDMIGHEEIPHGDGETEYSIWHTFQPHRTFLGGADDLWTAIANTLHADGNKDETELAKRIAFTLRIATLRLRDCAREYAWQNDYAVHQHAVANRGFGNLKTFDVGMALHSLLADMGTARDYLATFISEFILRDAKPVDSMPSLYGRVKVGSLKSSNASVQKLIDTVRTVCDRGRAEAWMARLGEFRNIVIHRSPLVNLSDSPLLQARTVQLGNSVLYQVHFGVPSDPFVEGSKQEDALQHFRGLLLNLLEFAHDVAAASGIKPTVPHVTPLTGAI